MSPRVGVYGKADAEADIAVHAALTTAIHGVGELHVAGIQTAGEDASRVFWNLPETLVALSDLNRTETLATPTSLDLRSHTSTKARFAILKIWLRPDTVGTGESCNINLRVTDVPQSASPRHAIYKDTSKAGNPQYAEVISPELDEDGTIQYTIYVATDWQLDTIIEVMGWIE